MIGFPLGSRVLGIGDDGLPDYSNPYKSRQLRAVNRQFFSDGVFGENAMKVSIEPAAGYSITNSPHVTVHVDSGMASLNGAFAVNLEKEQVGTITAPLSSTTNVDQFFIVKVRLNMNDGDESVTFKVQANESASSGADSDSHLDRSDTVYEICLAKVKCEASSSGANKWSIIDTRLSDSECGIASALVDIDTTQFFDRMNETIKNAEDSLEETLETTQEALNSALEEAQESLTSVIEETQSAQAKNNADQAANNAAAQGILVTILTEGEYDPDTLEPTVEGTVGKMYLVPFAAGGDDDGYIEYMYIDGKWERIGTTAQNLDPITTDDIDEIVDDDEYKTGTQTLNLTGLSYLWVKLKSAFANIIHKHSADDITSGTLGSDRISDDAVTSGKIANGAVGTAKLADGAVTSAKIADGTIATADLANSAVTNAKIADSAITSAKISDGTIATADLANGSVTDVKLAATQSLIATSTGTSYAGTAYTIGNAKLFALNCKIRSSNVVLATSVFTAAQLQAATGDGNRITASFAGDATNYSCACYYSGGKVYLKNSSSVDKAEIYRLL